MYMEPIAGAKTRKAVPQNTRVSNQTSAPKTAEPKKTESMDGESNRKQVEISKGLDESVTLSVMADDQIVDDQKNVNLEGLKKVVEQAIAAIAQQAGHGPGGGRGEHGPAGGLRRGAAVLL